jgi:argininosuccinate lyase
VSGGGEGEGRGRFLAGRFGEGMAAEMERFSSSIAVDLRMADEDLDGSIAHARALGEAGVVSAEEAARLVAGLEEVRGELLSGAFRPTDADEDVHMAVEARLGEKLGSLAGKLHTARSRNDQVATDVRLWLKRRLGEVDAALAGLIAALLDRIAADGRTLMPGYTHLQRGQPVLLGHHLLAHAWPLARDRERLAGARRRLDRSPLGAAALAGTPYPVDRRRSAELLGFAGVVENAMDAVAARDHELEVAAGCAIAMTHLSRMAEELVLWSTDEFAFVRLGEGYATGSSIMPQKRNPDAAELVRGKAARVIGDLTALVALVKGLPLAYDRDFQESREPLFGAVTTTRDCLGIMAGMWRTLEVRRDRFEAELAGSFSLATELADYLVGRGVPFREAHAAVGRLVAGCEERGIGLGDLTTEEAGRFHPELGRADLAPLLDPRAAVERRTGVGGTAWPEVERQVALLRRGLGS